MVVGVTSKSVVEIFGRLVQNDGWLEPGTAGNYCLICSLWCWWVVWLCGCNVGGPVCGNVGDVGGEEGLIAEAQHVFVVAGGTIISVVAIRGCRRLKLAAGWYLGPL